MEESVIRQLNTTIVSAPLMLTCIACMDNGVQILSHNFLRYLHNTNLLTFWDENDVTSNIPKFFEIAWSEIE